MCRILDTVTSHVWSTSSILVIIITAASCPVSTFNCLFFLILLFILILCLSQVFLVIYFNFYMFIWIHQLHILVTKWLWTFLINSLDWKCRFMEKLDGSPLLSYCGYILNHLFYGSQSSALELIFIAGKAHGSQYQDVVFLVTFLFPVVKMKTSWLDWVYFNSKLWTPEWTFSSIL